MGPKATAGFTLFEVILSSLILATVVLVALMVIPVGMRTQAVARSQLYAAGVAMSLADSFHNPIMDFSDIEQVRITRDDRVAQNLRNHGIHSAAYQFDFEKAVSRAFSGALPLPDDMARRLDSDNGEIARILDDGGKLYYVDPRFVRNLILGATRDIPQSKLDVPPELQKLVFGVVGYPQQNALNQIPEEGWPIYEIYPFPPNWLSYSQRQTRIGPVALPAPYQSGQTLTSGNEQIRFGDGGLRTWSWPDAAAFVTGTVNQAMIANTGADNAAGYHGRHWRHFQDRLASSPWRTGWPAFVRLAGDPTAGYLPFAGMVKPTPSYEALPSPTPSGVAPPGCDIWLPTYETRASYRDRAIELWNAVRPAALAAIPLTSTASTGITDTVLDTRYSSYITYANPKDLDAFQASWPQDLAAVPGQFPPHPAQVMALSYLAHASMAVAGWFPPWSTTIYERDRETTDIVNQTYDPLIKDNVSRRMGALVVTGIASANEIAVKADDGGDPANSLDARYFAGDYLWFQDDPAKVYRVGPNPARGDAAWIIPKTTSATIAVDRRYSVSGAGKFTLDASPVTFATTPSVGKRALRVASDADRAFARKVHEMCVRWAACYGMENQYDWGAPRPANNQNAWDRPLTMFDLWWDAAQRTGTSGNAIPTLSGYGTQTESRYRWIMGFNPVGTAWSPSPTSNPHNLSHFGPFDRRFDDFWTWRQRVTGAYPAQPYGAPAVASGHAPTDWSTSDDQRFWLARPFSPVHRARRLVFWSADWRSYQDAETLMSSVQDFSAYGQGIDQFNGDYWMYGTSTIADGLPLAGNPEGLYVWTDATRTARWTDTHGGDGAWYISKESDRDLMMGHWGADRNMNGKLDVGPVPRTARMRAVRVSEFVVYDPVIRLHQGN
ncbi:MAG: hypothetical protein RLZZ127_254 [Planctomycetota bacterium]